MYFFLTLAFTVCHLTCTYAGVLPSVIFPLCADGFYVTWGASEGAVMAPGQSLPPHGKQLGRLDSADLKQVIQKVHSEQLSSGVLCVCVVRLIGLSMHTYKCVYAQ